MAARAKSAAALSWVAVPASAAAVVVAMLAAAAVTAVWPRRHWWWRRRRKGGGDGGNGGNGGGGGNGGTADNLPMWGGKLYFTAPDGDYFCEAQFVSKNVVMTAAQCLQDEKSGDYYTNIRFVQDLPGGKKKTFESDCAATFTGWSKPGADKWTYDMGMVLLTEELQVGWMGFVWNYDKIGPFGYVNKADRVVPASGKLAGQKGIVQMTPKGGAKDMLGGAAWMTALKDDKGQLRTAFSLLSFTNPKQPGSFFGPYFDDKIKTLFDYAQNGCQ